MSFDSIELIYTACPNMINLRNYTNHFYSSDELLNRIWYAGAYTLQTNTISKKQGRVWGPPSSGWRNNALVGTRGDSIIVDGAKRDRTIWPGDLGVSLDTVFVSTNDVDSIKNTIDTLYDFQKTSGEFPFAGPQVNFYGSDTYHMWALVGTYNCYSYTNDKNWLKGVWDRYKTGVKFVLNKFSSNGLLLVTGVADWARIGQGGENIAANSLMYKVLVGSAKLASEIGDKEYASECTSRAAKLIVAINEYLWVPERGMYRDNPKSTMFPQDGNSLAVIYEIANLTQSQSISDQLEKNWNQFGSRCVEKNNNINGFPSSIEVHAHYKAKKTERALNLIRRQWGYQLNSKLSTNSTFWEGMKENGEFDYSGSYMSHAHGWSTGPTSALTFYSLGLKIDGNDFVDWSFIPHVGDLSFVEGQITNSLGSYKANWSLQDGVFNGLVKVPKDTKGEIGIPLISKGCVIKINNETVMTGGAIVHPKLKISIDEHFVYVHDLQERMYEIKVWN
ncbi:hypothetical protein AKO1_001581 [Acrasis kona]|uniref:Alpha-L-rhamnosidase six-hairpin glycosidase domain-containing protein n=1 Tax=Acrasis kona TaxID=1008807 RepID=A0AAW2ZCF9_9EUKA